MTVRVRSGGDHLLIAALAAGASQQAGAKHAGMSERTVRRRLSDPAFRKRVDEARAETVDRVVGRLTAVSTEAVETLRSLLGSEMDFARLGAARAILELGLKLREHGDLTSRLAALETTLEAREGAA